MISPDWRWLNNLAAAETSEIIDTYLHELLHNTNYNINANESHSDLWEIRTKSRRYDLFVYIAIDQDKLRLTALSVSPLSISLADPNLGQKIIEFLKLE